MQKLIAHKYSLLVVCVIWLILFAGLYNVEQTLTGMTSSDGSKVGYLISNKQDLQMIQSLPQFDSTQIYIDGNTNIQSQVRMSRVRNQLISIGLIAFCLTLIVILYLIWIATNQEHAHASLIDKWQQDDTTNRANQDHDLSVINSYINHELKNSLSVLKGKIYLESDDSLQYIDYMSRQIDDISALLQVELTADSSFKLSSLLNNVKGQFNNYNLNIQNTEKIEIIGNQLLIERVLFNIIENGFKYGADSVNVTTTIGTNIVFCIANNGPMIAPKELDRIFNLNYRINDLKANGSGIGLSLVKNIIDLHGGTIYVESDRLETKFYFTLSPLNK